jgi:3-phenylpropionate/cinnamic acid dioxygenase small subunit
MSAKLELQHDVEQFYYDEAALLDERLFLDWLALFTDDIRYTMPVRSLRYQADARHEFTSDNEVKHFDDDKAHLTLSVNRLMSGFAWSDEPRTRTRHVITNVRVRSGADKPAGPLEVHSAFVIHHGRGEHESYVFTGSRKDLLSRVDGSFRIAKRTILLDATVLPTNLGVFI